MSINSQSHFITAASSKISYNKILSRHFILLTFSEFLQQHKYASTFSNISIGHKLGFPILPFDYCFPTTLRQIFCIKEKRWSSDLRVPCCKCSEKGREYGKVISYCCASQHGTIMTRFAWKPLVVWRQSNYRFIASLSLANRITGRLACSFVNVRFLKCFKFNTKNVSLKKSNV